MAESLTSSSNTNMTPAEKKLAEETLAMFLKENPQCVEVLRAVEESKIETKVDKKLNEIAEDKEKKRKKKSLSPIKTLNLRQCTKEITWWRNNRRSQYNCALKVYNHLLNGKRYIVLYAPPKSGKRIIFEIIAVMHRYNCIIPDEKRHGRGTYKKPSSLCKKFSKSLQESNYFPPMHLTGFNRKSCRIQLKEQQDLGIHSEACGKKLEASDIINQYRKTYNITDENMKYVYCGIDEADYACGKGMILDTWISDWNGPQIYISATAEECEAGLKQRGFNSVVVRFEPPSEFKGKKWFLDNDLVKEPGDFKICINPKPSGWKKSWTEKQKEEYIPCFDLSNHAKGIINNCQNYMVEYLICDNKNNHKSRNIIIVRIMPSRKISYSSFKDMMQKRINGEAMRGILEDKYIDNKGVEKNIKFRMKFIDQHSTFKFDNRSAWDDLDKDVPFLLFICGKASRSTEFAQPEYNEEKEIISRGAHYRIFAMHDNRIVEVKSNYNTIAQAIGRANHYDKIGHPIILYCCPKTCRIEVGDKSGINLLRALPNISSRLTKNTDSENENSSSDDNSMSPYSHKPTNKSAYSKSNQPGYENKEKEPHIEKFGSDFESAKKYVQDKFGGSGPQKEKYSNTDKNGFLLCKIREEPWRVWSTDEMLAVCRAGIGARWRCRCCYADKKDKDTLQYWIVHY